MLDSLILNKKSIESIYKTIHEFHEKYLKQYGVKLPQLYNSKGKFTKDALVLVYLAYDYPKTRKVSKEELTKFIRSYYPDTNDVQQARHLGAQAGWWIVAGGRDNKGNTTIVVQLVAHKRANLIYIGRPRKPFCKKPIWTQINHWLRAI